MLRSPVRSRKIHDIESVKSLNPAAGDKGLTNFCVSSRSRRAAGHMTTDNSLLGDLESAISGGSSERRSEMLRRITDLYVAAAPTIGDAKAAVFDDVFAHLMRRSRRRRCSSSASAWPRSTRAGAADPAARRGRLDRRCGSRWLQVRAPLVRADRDQNRLRDRPSAPKHRSESERSSRPRRAAGSAAPARCRPRPCAR